MSHSDAVQPPGPASGPGAESARPDFPVVGIGASAGGLVALQRMIEHLPAASGMAFVVVLHLSPRHESSAGRILQRSTRIPVVQVTETTTLEPDVIYVISPRQLLTMADGKLCVAPGERPRGPHVAIDLFFRTLAEVHRERAMCVVLSGTGSDGSVGLSRVKECGGVTIAQLPQDAEYEDMPRNAIASGHVDFVLPTAEIPQKLLDIATNARHITLPGISGPDSFDNELPLDAQNGSDVEVALREIISMLAARTGHDFSHYKRATMLRRMERRMQVRLLKGLPAYRDYLRSHDEEIAPLLADMLISVTNFFRDREAYEALERDLLPELVASRPDGAQIRVWVPGCATGEEAYSIAMLVHDEARHANRPPSLQVFATDIDERAIAVARAAAYPASIVTDVPPARLREYFVADGGQYRIRKMLRECVLFAPHNALRDPPFSRLDLISCRNLLIYLNRNIQQRLLEMFHYALRDGGLLFLGSSESADVASELFEVVDKKHRIYRAIPATHVLRRTPTMPLRVNPAPVPAPAPRRTATLTQSFADLHQAAVSHFATPSVIVDDSANILHMSDRVGRYLQHSEGVPSHNLLALVQPALRIELRTALFQAVQTRKAIEARPVRLKPPLGYINMTVRPFDPGKPGSGCILVTFQEVDESMADGVSGDGDPGSDPVLRQLESELRSTREQLQQTIEQAEVSGEELRASNEELQAINEELRSTTEELETSAEELQSVNEELITVNNELKSKVDEAEQSNDDLRNFIASTEIATIFVDGEMRIRRYTPSAEGLFNLIASDIGRPLPDITHRLDYPQLHEDAVSVLDTLQTLEREVASRDGRRFVARMRPYQTSSRRVEGAVMTLVDITRLRDAQAQLARGEEDMRIALQRSADFAVIAMDVEGRIIGWNSGAEVVFGYTRAEIAGEHIRRLFVPEDLEAGVPGREMATARETGRAEDDRWHLRKDGTRVFCSGITTPVDVDGMRGYVKIARDVTDDYRDRKLHENELQQAHSLCANAEAAMALKDEFLAVMSHELRHPLNLINVHAEILSRAPDLDIERSPVASRALDALQQAVRAQGRIIDDLLDLSRIRTGKLALNRTAVDLVALAQDAVETASADASTSGLSLRLQHGEAPVLVNADRERLNQILWNLLGNAIKFTPPGGRITIEVALDRDCGRLDVVDTGQGIEPAAMPHIFELFGQARSRSTGSHGGLGIGLALVKQLVERHHGTVESSSPGPGKGARFTVWIPLYATGLGVAARAARQTPLDGIDIVVVDDDAQTANALRVLLEIKGAAVRAASSGAEALELAAQRRPGVVLTDIGMPGMDGYAVLAALRAMPGLSGLPVIALTGFGDDRDMRKAREAGFTDCIVKPVDFDSLYAVIGAVAGGS